MTLRFVKTSILVSEDGLDFSKETAVESEETRNNRLARETGAEKPLYQQLADQKQRKQDEYDANTKLLFSAPKGLDDEEFHFLESLNDAKERADKQKKAEVDQAVLEFRAARKLDNYELHKETHATKVVVRPSGTSNSLSLGTKVATVIRSESTI